MTKKSDTMEETTMLDGTNKESRLNKDSEILLAIVLESSRYIKSFKRSWTEIHSFFFEITNKKEFSDLFYDYLFDTNGPYPYCERLDEILSEFQLTGIIGSPNPILKEYLINVNIESAEDIHRSLSPDEIDKIKKIAEVFSQRIGIKNDREAKKVD